MSQPISIHRPEAERHLAGLGIFPGHSEGFSYTDLLEAVEQLLGKMESPEYSPESVRREQARGAAFLSAPATLHPGALHPYGINSMPPRNFGPDDELPPF